MGYPFNYGVTKWFSVHFGINWTRSKIALASLVQICELVQFIPEVHGKLFSYTILLIDVKGLFAFSIVKKRTIWAGIVYFFKQYEIYLIWIGF